MGQTTLDLRAGFASVVQAAKQDEAASTRTRPRVSQAQINLLRDMLFERFEDAEAQRRFGRFDWTAMSRAKFEEIFAWLKIQPKIERPVQTVVTDGYYTVVLDEATYRTIRVSRQDADAKFMPNRQILAYLNGPDNTGDYMNFGHMDPATGEPKIWSRHFGNKVLAEAVRVLMGGPKDAAQEYFRQSRNCSRCGRLITNPESIVNAGTNGGLGPTCESKGAW